MSTSMVFLILAGPVMAAGLLWYRADYRRYGRTTVPGVVALLAAWFMPMGVLGFSLPFFPAPTRPLQYVGYAVMLLGLVLLFVPLRRFASPMVVGRQVSGLITGGIYRYSRNPQYVATFLFVLGYAMTGRSGMAYVGVALYVVLAHLTALVEEEHLERVYGAEYRRYKATVSRYLPRFSTPRVATIDFHVTSECSQSCPYCWGPQDYDERAVDTATASAIVRRVAELGVNRIVFTGGDPLKRRDIGELLDLARSLGLEVALSTTGDELTREFLAAHSASIDLISLPLDGPSEEVSSRTKEPGHFATIMAVLDVLAEFPAIDVKVATPVTRLNLDAVPGIVALLERRHARQPNRFFYNVFQAYPRSMGAVDWSALLVTDGEFSALRERVGAASFPINWLSHETLDRLYVMIFPDGRVTVPSGSRFDDYGPFLDVTDLDALVARTDFDAPKHALHSRGWSRN